MGHPRQGGWAGLSGRGLHRRRARRCSVRRHRRLAVEGVAAPTGALAACRCPSRRPRHRCRRVRRRRCRRRRCRCRCRSCRRYRCHCLFRRRRLVRCRSRHRCRRCRCSCRRARRGAGAGRCFRSWRRRRRRGRRGGGPGQRGGQARRVLHRSSDRSTARTRARRDGRDRAEEGGASGCVRRPALRSGRPVGRRRREVRDVRRRRRLRARERDADRAAPDDEGRHDGHGGGDRTQRRECAGPPQLDATRFRGC